MAKEKNSRQCCGQIRRGSGYHIRHVQCEKTGKIERDGKWYCGTHDPVKRAEKRAAIQAKWQGDWDRKTRQYDSSTRLIAMAPLVLRALRGIASKEEASAVIEEWTSLVAEAIDCGLIKEAN